MTWSFLVLCCTTACTDNGATAPDATAVVMPPPVVVGLDRQVLAVGSKSQARSVFIKRDGGSVRVPVDGWHVISGSDVVGIDHDGMLVARSNGQATIAARIGSITWEMPVEVIPHIDDIDDAGLPSNQRVKPHLPAVLLDFPWPPVTGRTIRVSAGGNLQSALNSANRGDEIVLEGAAQFVGNYTLPAKAGTVADGWITIRGDIPVYPM